MMEDITSPIIWLFIGLATLASHVFQLLRPHGYGRIGFRIGWFVMVIAGLVFVGYVGAGGTVKIDIPSVYANVFRFACLVPVCSALYFSLFGNARAEATCDLTPQSHPSRTPPAP